MIWLLFKVTDTTYINASSFLFHAGFTNDMLIESESFCTIVHGSCTLAQVKYCKQLSLDKPDIKVAPYSFLCARADFENLAMAQAFKLHAKVARVITQ